GPDVEVGGEVGHRPGAEHGRVHVAGPGDHGQAGRDTQVGGGCRRHLADDRPRRYQVGQPGPVEPGPLEQFVVVRHVVDVPVVGDPVGGDRVVGRRRGAGQPQVQVV